MRTIVSRKAQRVMRLHSQEIARFQEGHHTWATAVIRMSIQGLKAIKVLKLWINCKTCPILLVIQNS
jgi:hypothetical protein